ncbi:hypothetical protein [Streptomyces sp. AM 2-1-1]|uniref:hypothetical protein n=1 Tax=Streptomyces sp. AM 2-1-1 TaxID=3028709 RepID=UPI0023B9FB90|nr:hypothetical protein [Streptomyces sp. AM 2-1-1]WEH42243.1 hypothetical protein PZB77_23620 [Streptomyces sp. AM 2-1-1]
MAEQDAERTGSDEEREPPQAEERAAVPGTPGEADEARPLDEDAVWAAIVAGYGEEPPDPPGAKPFKSVEDLALLTDDQINVLDGDDRPDDSADKGTGKSGLGSSVVFAPGVRGPRDHVLPDGTAAGDGSTAGEDGDDPDIEGHFVPPEPPPLPEADATSKFAWLGVVGSPVLMLLAVLLGWEMTWWLTTVCIGGFVGGCATLVARMPQDDDEDLGDPGHGAVV